MSGSAGQKTSLTSVLTAKREFFFRCLRRVAFGFVTQSPLIRAK